MSDKKTDTRSLEQIEADWYNEVSNYLYEKKGAAPLESISRANIVGKYLDYNMAVYEQTAENNMGLLKINDLYFTIDPQQISVNIDERSIDIPQIRSKHSIKIATGYGEVSVSMQLTFCANPAVRYNGQPVTLLDEINYKMIPLLTQLKNMPFCHVENEYLRNKLMLKLEEASIVSDESALDVPDIMLTYVSHSLSTNIESSEIVTLNLQFLLFNYKPYMPVPMFVGDYVRENGYIKRDPLTGAIEKPGTPVFNPEQSFPFYEFHAGEMKRVERDWLLNYSDPQRLALTYYKYIAVPRSAVTGESEKKIAPAIVPYDKAEVPATKRSEATIRENATDLTKLVEIGAIYKDVCITGLDPKVVRFLNDEAKNFYDFNKVRVTSARRGGDTKKPSTGGRSPHNTGRGLDFQPVGGFYYDAGHNSKSHYSHFHATKEFNDAMQTVADYCWSKRQEYGISQVIWNAKVREGNSDTEKPYRYSQETASDMHLNHVHVSFNGTAKKTSATERLAAASEPLKKKASVSKTTEAEKKKENDEVNQKERERFLTIMKLLKEIGIKDSDIEIKEPDKSSSYVYIKYPWTVVINDRQPIMPLISVEVVGGHDVPRIPLSDYRFATHQYMGGHVEKVTLNFVVPEPVAGELELQKMRTAFETVSDNLLKYRDVSCLDGIYIDNSFINAMIGGNNFVVDSTTVKTHPEIPGGSIVSVTLTDYTRVSEHLKKAAYFKKQESLGAASMPAIYKDIAREIFDKAKIGINRNTVIVSKDQRKMSQFSQEAANFCNIGMNFTASASFESRAMNDAVEDLLKELNSVSFSHRQLDLYDVFPYLWANIKDKKISVSDIPSHTVLDDYHPEKEITKFTLKQILGSRLIKKSSDGNVQEPLSRGFFNKIESWISLHFDTLHGNLPNIKMQYPREAIKATDITPTPAYMDFDLPPTIDPNYYFYEINKFYMGDKNQKADVGKEEDDRLSQRFKTYLEQLKVNDKYSTDTENDNIICQLAGGVGGNNEFYKSLTFDKGATSDENKPFSGSDYNLRVTNFLKTIPKEKKEDYVKNLLVPSHLQKKNMEDFLISCASEIENPGNTINQNPDVARSLTYTAGSDAYMKLLYYRHAIANASVQRAFTMAKCFPVYKLYFIEEDDIELAYPIRKTDLNELYGINCVQEVRLVQHSDQPADLLTVRFVDLTGRFTSQRYDPTPEAAKEDKSSQKRDTHASFGLDTAENEFDGIMAQEGTRVQLKLGYTNNINELETVFNGQIVSIEGEFNSYTMICQSYGMETVLDIKGENEPVDITTFNAETAEILDWCVNQPEMRHFGRWKLSDAGNFQFSDNASGFNIDGGYIRQRADGSEQKVWSWTKDEADLNILAPTESSWTGVEQFWEVLCDSSGLNLAIPGLILVAGLAAPVLATSGFITSIGSIAAFAPAAAALLLTAAIAYFLFYLITSTFTKYFVYRKTVWEVIDEMTYRYPGFVAKVLPYGDRCTLFYGPPDAPYFYRPFTVEEKINKLKIMSNAHFRPKYEAAKKEIQEKGELVAVATSDKMTFGASGGAGASYSNRDNINTRRNKINHVTAEFFNSMKKNIPVIEQAKVEDFKTVRLLRQYWTADSSHNIMFNNIKADYRDVYTEISVLYGSDQKDNVRGNMAGDNVRIKMNDFLKTEDIRTKVLASGNCVTQLMAYRYGAHELWRQARKLYKGSLTMLGNPSMKPFDRLVVLDEHTQMYGPVEIVQHVISIAPGEGMTSVVTPGMVASINDMVSMSISDARQTMAADEHVKDTLSSIHNRLPGILDSLAVAGIVKLIYNTAISKAVFSPLSIPTVVFTSFSLLSIARKISLMSQFREPIFLHPMSRNGIPYVVGVHTFRTGGIIEYYNDKYNVMVKDIRNGLNVIQGGIDEAYNSYFGT